MRTITKRLTKALSVVLVIAVVALAWFQRYNINDWVKLRNYNPPAKVAKIADQDTMTEYGRKLFYVNHPDFEDKTNFSDNCPTQEKTIVLGCYIRNKGIFLFTVTDKRLNGVEQVTAAHEMLHAAYDRLDVKEKAHVDSLINKAYSKVTDERIKNTVESYRKSDADVTNELHSILGTEVRNLPTELEQYYSRYFNNREAVVAYSEKYESQFTSRQLQVADYDHKLQQSRLLIDAKQQDVEQLGNSINQQRQQLDSYLNNNQTAEYNARVNDFNSQVSAYNSQVQALRTLINDYNATVVARNKIALEESNLAKSIDSRPQSISPEAQ